MMKKRSIQLLFATWIAVCFVVFPFQTQAHLEAAEDTVVGDFLIDFGYDPAEPLAGERTTLAFNLVDNAQQEMTDFDYAWVRISHGDAILFSGNFSPQAGNITFSYTFPEPGDYDVEAHFYIDKEIITESTFVLPVHGAAATVPTTDATVEGESIADTDAAVDPQNAGWKKIPLVAVVVVSFVIGILYGRKKRSS